VQDWFRKARSLWNFVLILVVSLDIPVSCAARFGKFIRVVFKPGSSVMQLFLCHRLCGLVIRVPGYRSRGPGFDSQHYQIF
jgi:hypothetical protein